MNLLLQFHPDDIMRKYGEGWAVAYFFGLCMAAGLALLVIIGFIARAFHRRRLRQRSEWGHPKGLRPVDTLESTKSIFNTRSLEISEKILRDYPYYNPFKQPRAIASCILEGYIDGMQCRTFDFSYFTGTGKHSIEYPFSIVAFHYTRIKPYTALRRRERRDGLAENDIQTGWAELDEKFYVYADDWGLLKNELHQELEQLIVRSNIYDLFLADRTLLVVARKRLKNEGYDQLYATAHRLAVYFYNKI